MEWSLRINVFSCQGLTGHFIWISDSSLPARPQDYIRTDKLQHVIAQTGCTTRTHGKTQKGLILDWEHPYLIFVMKMCACKKKTNIRYGNTWGIELVVSPLTHTKVTSRSPRATDRKRPDLRLRKETSSDISENYLSLLCSNTLSASDGSSSSVTSSPDRCKTSSQLPCPLIWSPDQIETNHNTTRNSRI